MARKSLKRYILEKLEKLNECGGSSSYYSASCSGTPSFRNSSSSSGGSCGFGSSSSSSQLGRASSRNTARSNIKELTSQIYGNSKIMVGYVEKMMDISKQQRKNIPSQLKNTLQKLKTASEEYIKLIDYYTESI